MVGSRGQSRWAGRGAVVAAAAAVLGLGTPALVLAVETPTASLIASTDPAVQANVRAALAVKGSGGDVAKDGAPAQADLLTAIERSPSAPEWLAEPLAALARDGDVSQRVAAVRALGAVRCRGALAALITAARDRNEPRVADAALASLARLTGRTDLGADLNGWTALLAQVEVLSEEAWRGQLAAWLAARVEGAGAERDAVTARLTDLLRARVLAGVLPSDRTAALSDMLTDALPAVRKAGYTLAMSELANARAPGDGVLTAAVGGLKDPSPELRRAAAELLAALASPASADGLAAAAKAEDDPSVAANLLRALARVRPPGCLETAVVWAERDGVARVPALEAVAALSADGPVEDALKARVLAVIASRPLAEASAAGLRLACLWGTDADRAEVARLQATTDPGLRATAAEALSADARGLDALLAAARDDATLFEPAARGVTRFRATAAGYAALAMLPAPSVEARNAALERVAALLPTPGLVAIARSSADAAFREAILSRLTSPGDGPSPENGPDRTARAEGLLLLARTRLELNQPALALSALDALAAPSAGLASDRPACDAVRMMALCALGRVDEAERLDVPALPWVEALERSADGPHARRVLAAVERKYGLQLETELVARVDAVRRRLGAFVGPEMER